MTIEHPKPIFNCDRCGHTEEMEPACRPHASPVLPKGSLSLKAYVASDGVHSHFHMCTKCKDAFVVFMTPVGAAPKARNQSEAGSQKARGDAEFLAQKDIR